MSGATTTGSGRWLDVCASWELPVGGHRVLKADDARGGKHQLALFRAEDDVVYAVDNRCPHEGYPLVQGYVVGCVLTCAWHNFKFDLRDGACIVGDEAVASHPVRVDEARDVVQVWLADPPADGPSEDIEARITSLHDGLYRRRMGQVSRDVIRLLRADVPAARIVLEAVRFDGIYTEYGSSHALPMAEDGLRIIEALEATLIPTAAGSEPTDELASATALMQAMHQAADAGSWHPPRPSPPAADAQATGELATVGERLVALVEAEEVDAAEGLFRGALAAGADRGQVQQWLHRLSTDHFHDFGHALIYQVKAFDLLARPQIGWESAGVVLPAALSRLAWGTREDTLPPWKAWRQRLDAVAASGELQQLWKARTNERPAGSVALEDQPLLDTLLGGSDAACFDALLDALRSGWPLAAIVDVLSRGASRRLLWFDIGTDANPAIQEAWLDVTHRLTYVEAVRHAVRRYDDWRALRLLFFAARFVRGAEPLDLPAAARIDHVAAFEAAAPTPADPGAGSAPDSALLDCLRAHDGPGAVDLACSLLRGAGGASLVQRSILGWALAEEPLARPIFATHLYKTVIAAFSEHAALSGRGADEAEAALPVLAAVRFAAGPLKERRIRSALQDGHAFVVEGRVPTRLSR